MRPEYGIFLSNRTDCEMRSFTNSAFCGLSSAMYAINSRRSRLARELQTGFPRWLSIYDARVPRV